MSSFLFFRDDMSHQLDYGPRWIVAELHPLAGLCNRFTHLISCLAFARATNRTLLFDWNSEILSASSSGAEYISQSAFEDVFLKPPIEFSYTRALQKYGARSDSIRIDTDNTRFLNDLRHTDIDKMYPQSVVYIARYDWWAPPLIMNKMYTDVFGNKSSHDIFSEFFQFLFQPKSSQRTTCDWLIQYRAVWERKTAPFSDFVACARLQGLQKNERVLISSDSVGSVHPVIANSTIMPEGCRNSTQCDVEAVKTIYALSNCKKAVITDTSTFGTCIAGLGKMKDVYYVNSTGSCVQKETVDPIDAGVLVGQEKQVTNAIRFPKQSITGAFVFMLLGNVSDQIIRDMKRTLRSLHTFFPRFYSVVIFATSSPSSLMFLQKFTQSRVYVVKVTESDWAAPEGNFPEIFRLGDTYPMHQGFSISYRQMSRWSAGFLYTHPFLKRFDYVIKMDHDTVPDGPWTKDPFEEMAKGGKDIGYWMAYSDIDDVTKNLWNTFAEFLQEKHLQLKIPSLLLDQQNRYQNTNFYGCFIGFRVSTFSSERYTEIFRFLDAKNGFMKYRWDEQKVLAFFVALYFSPEQIEFFDYVRVTHQVFNKALPYNPLVKC
jgi:hypothetical protein